MPQMQALASANRELAVAPAVLADEDASPASRPASASQIRKAVIVCGVIALVTACFAPIADVQWSFVPAFLPSYQTAVIVAYVITGYLIFAQYQVTRALSLLYLSGGCFYTAAILIAQFLSMPGMFLEHATLYGGSQTTIWLWCFWHFGPSAGILLYAVTDWLKPGLLVDNTKKAAWCFGALLVLVFGASIACVTVFQDWLPVLDLGGGDFHRIVTTGVAPAIQVLTAISIGLLWRVTGFRTTLQLWLGVALFALFCDNLITMLGGNRLSVGWYIGRLNALISAAAILLVYLAEINRAYFNSAREARQITASFAELEVKADKARVDHLTGLSGRALFLEQVEASRAHKLGRDQSVAVLFVDLDGFKEINDRFGHDRGDATLVKTAGILRSAVRETDVIGRFGGDEFVVCLTAPTAVIDGLASTVAARIVDRIAELGDGVGASVGVALCSVDSLDIEAAIRQADEAMYAAKERGKSRFTFFGRPRLVVVA